METTNQPKTTAKPAQKKSAPASRKGVKKRRTTKNIGSGQVHIQSTFNNNLVTIADQTGAVIAQCSSGRLGFKGSRKDTPFAAQQVAENAGRKAKEMGLNSAAVFVKGAGAGREAAIRGLANAGIEVTSIKDVSSIPFNGCRPSKRRRV